MSSLSIEHRKSQHLRVCLDELVEPGAGGGLDDFRLDYRALPEIDLQQVDLTTQIAGKTLRAPLIIGAMTGGTPEARTVNRILAQAAQETGVGFALGSGRALLEDPGLLPTFDVRNVAPDVLLFANLGAVQLNCGYGGEEAARLVELLGADALNLHLNPLQEAIQEGGDTNFAGLTTRMREALPTIACPVFVKEVGAGIGSDTAHRLAELPIAGIETAGVGGTSWARVEALRAAGRQAREAGIALESVGVPTAECIQICRSALGNRRTVIASGGLRHPVHMATALALGADAVACALPFLKAASQGFDAVVELIQYYSHTLRILCFVCGAPTPAHMRGRLVRRA